MIGPLSEHFELCLRCYCYKIQFFHAFSLKRGETRASGMNGFENLISNGLSENLIEKVTTHDYGPVFMLLGHFLG